MRRGRVTCGRGCARRGRIRISAASARRFLHRRADAAPAAPKRKTPTGRNLWAFFISTSVWRCNAGQGTAAEETAGSEAAFAGESRPQFACEWLAEQLLQFRLLVRGQYCGRLHAASVGMFTLTWAPALTPTCCVWVTSCPLSLQRASTSYVYCLPGVSAGETYSRTEPVEVGRRAAERDPGARGHRRRDVLLNRHVRCRKDYLRDIARGKGGGCLLPFARVAI
jgi:hypothetical protein